MFKVGDRIRVIGSNRPVTHNCYGYVIGIGSIYITVKIVEGIGEGHEFTYRRNEIKKVSNNGTGTSINPVVIQSDTESRPAKK